VTALFVLTLAIPAVCAVVTWLVRSPRAVLGICVVGSAACAVGTVVCAREAFSAPLFAIGRQLMLDSLAAYHALLVVGVFVMSSVYACYYFAPAIADGSFDARKARRFGALWFLFLGSMLLTLASNNAGLMWVALEGTTITSALLVCLDRDKPAVRAAWTYLLMCSVAIALALIGIITLCAEAQRVGPDSSSIFLWTTLRKLAPRLNPGTVRLAFIFAFVGFGTKAGLAPMHSWLPEAHGHAPTPVSAVLSGVLLNCALYCLSRFLPVVAQSNPGWTTSVLVPFGILSMVVAAAFIVHEHDIKRLLAYHTVEHMGIIVLALGFGAFPAALFHTFNHSVCKMLTFFCGGALAQRYGTRDMSHMHGTLRREAVAGGGLLIGLFALIGMPPFSIFMSELWIAVVGIEGGHVAAVVAFFCAAGLVFIAAFRHAIEMTWPQKDAPEPNGPRGRVGLGLVAVPLALLFLIGVWMPLHVSNMLASAASVIGGQ